MSEGEKEDGRPWVFLCHGAANVGQISNDAARELVREGKVRMACVAAAGAHADSFLKPFRAGRTIIAVDGCPMRCTSKTLELAGLPVVKHIMVTELGLKKSGDLNYTAHEVGELKNKLEREIGSVKEKDQATGLITIRS